MSSEEICLQQKRMNSIIQFLTSKDEPFLWEMLYQALYIPEGQSALPREVVHLPELSRYVKGWGREGDCGLFVSDTVIGQPVGAVWLRLLVGDNKGYGYVNDDTPELGIAVLPEYRGQGIGTQLLTHLFASVCGQSSISLSVSANNPAVRLYKRFGFEILSKTDESLLMKRDYRQNGDRIHPRSSVA
jgi:ribosomal protein S18 acetylase RimI-like enzyme